MLDHSFSCGLDCRVTYVMMAACLCNALLMGQDDTERTLDGQRNVPNTTAEPRLLSDWLIDLDIDSDNTNHFDLPDGSNWEDEIESHDFSIGKLIETKASQFTPVLVRLNTNVIRSTDLQVQFDIENALGEVKLWRKARADVVDTNDEVITNGIPIPLDQLTFDSSTGIATIWLEAIIAAPGVGTKEEIDKDGRPDMFLKVMLLRRDTHEIETDKVKYLPVNPGSFFTHFVAPANRATRNAIAAILVNGSGGRRGEERTVNPYESKAFGMRIVPEAEFQNFLMASKLKESQSSILIDVLYYKLNSYADPSKQGLIGLRLVVYRDYNSGDFTIAFQNSLKDNTQDVFRKQTRNGLNFRSMESFESLTKAARAHRMRTNLVCTYLRDGFGVELQGLQIAGCGIGGELAVFGALSSGLHADTYDTTPFPEEMIKVILQPYDPHLKKRYEFQENGSLARLEEVTKKISGYKITESPFEVLPSTFPIEN